LQLITEQGNKGPKAWPRTSGSWSMKPCSKNAPSP
jgi:hypothetical protein